MSIILPRETWVASGHVGTFTDPLVECLNCHKRRRQDHLQEALAEKKGIEDPDSIPMSDIVCPDCGSEHDIFGTGGGDKMARELGLEVLGRIPIEPGVRAGGDAGVPITSAQYPGSETSAAATALRQVARTVAGRVSVLAAPVAVATAAMDVEGCGW